MSAPGAQEAQLGRLDVLQYGGERAVGLSPSREAEVKQLREARLTSGGREVFRACLNMREDEVQYRHESTLQFQSRFGAGEARYDATTRTVTAPTSPEKKAVYDEAKRLIEQSTRVLSYLEVLSSSDPNATFAAIRSRPELSGFTNINGLRSAALDTIAADPAFQKMFPELFAKGITDTARRNMIEDTLARDSRFQARLAARMEAIYEAAQKVPEVKANTQLETDRLKTQGDLDTKVRQIVDQLRKAGAAQIPPGSSTPVTEASVRAIIDANASSPASVDIFVKTLTGIDVPATLALVSANPSAQTAFTSGDFDGIRAQIPTISNAEIQALQNFRINLNTVTLPGYAIPANEIQDFVTRHAGNVTALDVNDLARQIISDWNVRDSTNYFTDQTKIAEAKVIARAMLPPTGNAAIAIGDLVRDAGELSVKVKGIETRLKTDSDTLQSERIRLIEESKLLSQLESVLGNALVDVMEDRYDQMIPLEEERLAAAAKKAEEDKKTELATLIRKLGDTKSKRWVEYNRSTRKRETHRDRISSDMQELIYASNQEEQIKTMLMRDSGYVITDYYDSKGVKHPVTTAMQIDYITGIVRDTSTKAELGKADLTTLNELYKSEKDAYVQKLFGSYFASRRFYDRSFAGKAFGELGMKDHEWVLLERQFGTQVTEALSSDQNARAAIDKLKSEGVIADFKLKWLLYLLLIVGGAVALGPAGALLGTSLGGGAAAAIGGKVAAGTIGGAIGSKIAGATSERIH